MSGEAAQDARACIWDPGVFSMVKLLLAWSELVYIVELDYVIIYYSWSLSFVVLCLVNLFRV